MIDDPESVTRKVAVSSTCVPEMIQSALRVPPVATVTSADTTVVSFETATLRIGSAPLRKRVPPNLLGMKPLEYTDEPALRPEPVLITTNDGRSFASLPIP